MPQRFHAPNNPKSSKTINNRRRKLNRRVEQSEFEYQVLEPRQLLAGLSFSNDTLDVDCTNMQDEIYFQVNANNELVWSSDGGTFNNDLDENTVGDQIYVMNAASPIDINFDMSIGSDLIQLDLGGVAGIRNITVNDDDGIDTIAIVSDLNLLPAGGSATFEAEILNVDAGVQVTAPGGFSVTSTKNGMVTIGDSSMISTREITPGGDHLTDLSTGDSGDLSFSAEVISVGNEVLLFAHADSGFSAGDILVEAAAELPPIVDLSTVDLSTGPLIEDFLTPTSIASVDIGSATIQGDNVNITAMASNDFIVPELSELFDVTSFSLEPSLFTSIVDILSDEASNWITTTDEIPAFYVKEISTATINIGQNATLVANSNVNISAEVDATQNGVVQADTQAWVAVNVCAKSEINIAEGTAITAGNNVDVETDTSIVALSNAQTHKNLNATTPEEKIALAMATTRTDLVSHIEVFPDTVITAGNNIDVNAVGNSFTRSNAEAGVYQSGGAGTTIAYNFPNSSVQAHVDGNLTADATDTNNQTGITVTADLTSNTESRSISGLGDAQPDISVTSLPSPIDQVEHKIVEIVNFAIALLNGIELFDLFELNENRAFSVAFNESDNIALAEIGSTADLKSRLDIRVASNLSDRTRTFSESTIAAPQSGNLPVDQKMAALVVGLYNNSSRAVLLPNAIADATRMLNVDADTIYPFQPTITDNNASGFYEIEGNSWARSHSESGRAESAWALNYQQHDNVTEAHVGDRAMINQDSGYTSDEQSVEIEADTEIILLDIAGLFKLDVDQDELDDLSGTIQDTIFDGKDLNIPWLALGEALQASWDQVIEDSEVAFGTNSRDTGMGGAITVTNMTDSTLASIGDEAHVTTGSSGFLSVDANSQVDHYAFAAAGIKARQQGIEGSFAYNVHKQDTIASIGNGVVIDSGSINVISNSVSNKYSFAGDVMFGSNRGYGVSFAMNDLERNTLAYVGSADGSLGETFDITSGNRFNVFATSDGVEFAAALAASIPGNAPVSSNNNGSGDTDSNFENNGQQGNFGFAVSADGAVNRSTNITKAFIDNFGSISTRALSVSADELTSVFAGSGSIIIQDAAKRSKGFAGSFALNNLVGDVEAGIRGANVFSTTTVSTRATRSDDVKILAASLGATNASEWGVVGSAALNIVDFETDADFTDANISSLNSAFLTASDLARITSIAGAATWSGKLGIGSAYSRNDVSYRTTTNIAGSSLSLSSNLTAIANHDLCVNAIAGSAGIGQNVGVAGTVARNVVAGQVRTGLLDSGVTSANAEFTATDNSRIRAYSGSVEAFGESTGFGFAGAYAGNQIVQEVGTSSSNSEINASGTVRFDTDNLLTMIAFGLGVEHGASVSLAMSIASNNLDTDVYSTVATTGLSGSDISIDSLNEATVNTFSGGFGLGAQAVAIGAAVSVTEINSLLDSHLVNSTTNSTLGFHLGAHDKSQIDGIAVGGTFADVFSLGGSYAENTIDSTISTYVFGSSVSALRDINVIAEDDSNVTSISGGIAAVSQISVGAAVSVNEITTTMTSRITNSSINSTFGSLHVEGMSKSVIKAIALGGTLAQNFALGGSVSTNEVTSNLDVNISRSSAEAQNDITVNATNDDNITADTGGIGIAGIGSVGASVSTNQIDIGIQANVYQSEVTSTSRNVEVASNNHSVIKAFAIGGTLAQLFAVGGSVTINRIDTSIFTNIADASIINAEGNIDVLSDDRSVIHGIAGGVGITAGTGVGVGIVDNKVIREVETVITSSDATSHGGSVGVKTDVDQRGLTGIAIGGALAGAVTVSGSVAVNNLKQNVTSKIDGESDVLAAKHIFVTAESSEHLSTNAFAAGISGVVAGAGAVASTNVENTNMAFVGPNSSAKSNGNVSINSVDNTNANAIGGGVGVASTVGVGASVSTVQIHKDTQAYIDREAIVQAVGSIKDSVQVYSGDQTASDYGYETIRGVAVQATSNEDVSNFTIAGAAAGAAAVAGSVTVEVISPHTEAWIGQGAIVQAGGQWVIPPISTIRPEGRTETNVNVSAKNFSDIVSTTGSAGLGIAGISGSVDVGKIQHVTWAHIDTSASVNARHDIDLHALSKKDVNNVTISAAVGYAAVQASISVWNIGSQFNADYSVEGVDSNALTQSGNDVADYASLAVEIARQHTASYLGEVPDEPVVMDDLEDSTQSQVLASVHPNANLIAGDGVDTRAKEWLNIDQTTGGVGIGFVGAGASVSLVNINTDTEALVVGAIEAQGDVLLEATLDETVNTDAYAGTGGIVTLGASVAIVDEDSTQTASLGNFGEISKADDVTIQANNFQDIDAYTAQAGIAGVALGASVAKVNAVGSTRSYIVGSTIGTHLDEPTCDARSNPMVTNVNLLTNVDQFLAANAIALSGGVIGAYANIAEVNGTQRISTWIGKSSVIATKQDVVVKDDSSIGGFTDAVGASINGVNVGISKSIANITPVISTAVEDPYICATRDVIVESHNYSSAYADGDALAVAGIGVQSIKVDALAIPRVNTQIHGDGTYVEAGRNITVGSYVDQVASAEANGMTLTIAGAGLVDAIAVTDAIVNSTVYDDPQIVSGNDFTIISVGSGSSEADVVSPTVGIATGFAAEAIAESTFDSLATFESATFIHVGGAFNIEAHSTRIADADAEVVQYGVIGAGSNRAHAIAVGSTIANSVGDIDYAGSMFINANEYATMNATGFSAVGELFGGLGLDVYTQYSPTISAIMASRALNINGNLDLNANSTAFNRVQGQATNVGFLGYGTTKITTSITPDINAVITRTAEVNVGEDISLTATHSLEPDGVHMLSGQSGQIQLIAGGTGLDLEANSNPRVHSEIQEDALVLSVRDISLTSIASSNITASDDSFSYAGLLGLGTSESGIHSTGSISTRLKGAIREVRNVILRSDSSMDAKATSYAGTGAIGISAGGAEANVIVNPAVRSTIHTAIDATGSVFITSASKSDSTASALGAVVAGIIGSGDTLANVNISPYVDARVEVEMEIAAAGGISISAWHNSESENPVMDKRATAIAQATSGAIIGSFTVTDAHATSNPLVYARALDKSSLAAGSGIRIEASSFSEAITEGEGDAWGFFVGVGNVDASAISTGITEAGLQNVEFASSQQNSIEIFARGRSDAHGIVSATAAGILASGTSAELDIISAPVVSAFASANEFISSGNMFQMLASVLGDVTGSISENSGGGIYNQGDIHVEGQWGPTATSIVHRNTEISAGGHIRIGAFGNHLAQGPVDVDRIVDLATHSEGGALFTGRESTAALLIDPTVHAQVESGAILDSNGNLEILALSTVEPNIFAYTKMPDLGFGKSKSTAYIFTNMSTRAETLSGGPVELSSANQTRVDSISTFRGSAIAEARGGLIASREAAAIIFIAGLDTVSILSTDTNTNSGGDLTVKAVKNLAANVDADVGTFGMDVEIVFATGILTVAEDNGSSTAGGFYTVEAIDPIIINANATLQADESVEMTDEEYLRFIVENDMVPKAHVTVEASISSGFDERARVSAEKGIYVKSELREYTVNVSAQIIAPSGRVYAGDELVDAVISVRTQLGDFRTFKQEFTDLCSGANYVGEIFRSRDRSYATETLDDGCRERSSQNHFKPAPYHFPKDDSLALPNRDVNSFNETESTEEFLLLVGSQELDLVIEPAFDQTFMQSDVDEIFAFIGADEFQADKN